MKEGETMNIDFHPDVKDEFKIKITKAMNAFQKEYPVFDVEKELPFDKVVIANHACIFNKTKNINWPAVVIATNGKCCFIQFMAGRGREFYRCEDIDIRWDQ